MRTRVQIKSKPMGRVESVYIKPAFLFYCFDCFKQEVGGESPMKKLIAFISLPVKTLRVKDNARRKRNSVWHSVPHGNKGFKPLFYCLLFLLAKDVVGITK